MKYCKSNHKYILAATTLSGKKYWLCITCKHKTDMNPRPPDMLAYDPRFLWIKND